MPAPQRSACVHQRVAGEQASYGPQMITARLGPMLPTLGVPLARDRAAMAWPRVGAASAIRGTGKKYKEAMPGISARYKRRRASVRSRQSLGEFEQIALHRFHEPLPSDR